MIRHASHSAVSAYTRCGKAFELKRIMNYPEAPAWYLIAGSAVHRACDEWDTGNGSSPTNLFLDAFDQEIELARAVEPDESKWRAGGWGANGQRYAHWASKGPAYLEQWASTTFPGSLFAIELDVSTVLPSGLRVKAFIDRVYQTGQAAYTIWDLKSGASRPDSDQQLGFYKALFENTFDEPVTVEAGNYMFKDDRDYLMDVSRWDVGVVDRLCRQWKRAVSSKAFLPVRGKQCDSCGVSAACYLASGDTGTTRTYDSLNPHFGLHTRGNDDSLSPEISV